MPGTFPAGGTTSARRRRSRKPTASSARDPENRGRQLGGLGGTPLVVGVRWSFRGKDAGSVNSRKLLARLRYQGGASVGEQRGPTAPDCVSPSPPLALLEDVDRAGGHEQDRDRRDRRLG